MRWLWSDAETMAPVGGPVLLDDDQTERWFHRVVDPGNPLDRYHVIVDPNDRLIGEASWHRLDPYTMTAELNIKVAAAERRHGHARQALELLLRDFFCVRGGRLIIDDVAPDNVAGQRMLLRFGFERATSARDVYRLVMRRERFLTSYGCTGAARGAASEASGAPA